MTTMIDEQANLASDYAAQWSLEFLSTPFEAIRMLEKVRDVLGRDPDAARAGVDRLTRLLKIATCSPERVLSRGGLAPWQKRKVESYIGERLGTPIPIMVLADLVALSTGHFRRAFKRSYGDCPHTYIVRRRIARAQELMLTSSEPLGQLALICGFSDQAHFTTLFRRFVGTTPSNWRRTYAVRSLSRSRNTHASALQSSLD